MEGESLAIYSGCLMNRRYLFGRPFTVKTDHSALPALYNNSGRPAPHRVDRHRGRLGAFDMTVEYVPGNRMPCDYGSRHPDQLPPNLTKQQREEMGIETEEEDKEIWVMKLTREALPAITLEELREKTEEDPELKLIKEEKQAGTKSKKMSKGPYGKMWEEIRERDGILLKGDKLIVPKSLQAQAIALAHEGHMQADGTLRQLRETQWFRGMRAKVQEYVDTCRGCAPANPRNPTPPLKKRPLPKNPWEVTVCDYKGPIGVGIGGMGGYYLHTMMDVYSRYPEVHLMKSNKFEELEKVLNKTMRTNGTPKEIWADNGSPYNSDNWRKWVRNWGAKPRFTTPYHPMANGMVERFNQNLKKVIYASYNEGTDVEEAVDKYVAAYRNTPHSTTGEKPSKLMWNRDIATKLPSFTKDAKGRHHSQARKRDQEETKKMAQRYDQKHQARQVNFKVGDYAYKKELAPTTKKGPFEAKPYKITEIYKNQITGERDGQTATRDRKDWKLAPPRPEHLKMPEERKGRQKGRDRNRSRNSSTVLPATKQLGFHTRLYRESASQEPGINPDP